jgi:hypothetical protein
LCSGRCYVGTATTNGAVQHETEVCGLWQWRVCWFQRQESHPERQAGHARHSSTTEQQNIGNGNCKAGAYTQETKIFWVVTPCTLVGTHQGFGETYCLHLQGRRRQRPELIESCGKPFGLAPR